MNDSKPPFLTRSDIVVGLTCYVMTTAVVVLGVSLGRDFVKRPAYRNLPDCDFLECFARFDGLHYQRICVEGYSYDPDQRSVVAFFPAYPLTARLVMRLFRCRSILALLIVAHVSLAAAFVLLNAYARHRYPEASPRLLYSISLTFGLLPSTFFFRMAYSESLFVLLTLLALLAIERRWPLWLTAVIIGLLTATRPVGVAFVPVFALHVWHRSSDWRSFIHSSVAHIPLACCGLAMYIAYQQATFQEPLAFAKTQEHWNLRPTTAGWDAKLRSLILLEPLWSPLLADSPHYWQTRESHSNPLFSLLVANQVFFSLTAALALLGIWNRWVSSYETLLTFGLLLIPFLTRGYEMLMSSSGRFAAVTIPTYLVIGRLLSFQQRTTAATVTWLVGTVFLALYTALFAAGHLLF
jgi:hypothetical protein